MWQRRRFTDVRVRKLFDSLGGRQSSGVQFPRNCTPELYPCFVEELYPGAVICCLASWVSQWLTFSASSSRPNRGASACHEQMVQRPRLRSTSHISVSGERQGAVTRVEGPLPYIPEWKRAKTKWKLVIWTSVGPDFCAFAMNFRRFLFYSTLKYKIKINFIFFHPSRPLYERTF